MVARRGGAARRTRHTCEAPFDDAGVDVEEMSSQRREGCAAGPVLARPRNGASAEEEALVELPEVVEAHLGGELARRVARASRAGTQRGRSRGHGRARRGAAP